MKMWRMKITAAAARAGSGLCRALLSHSLTAGFNRYSKIRKQAKQREGGNTQQWEEYSHRNFIRGSLGVILCDRNCCSRL